MATRFYLTDDVSNVTIQQDGNNTNRIASFARDTALQVSDDTATVAGPSAEVKVKEGTFLLDFYTPTLNGVTISGLITANLWMSESSALANCGAYIILQRMASDGTFIESLSGNVHGVEFPVTTRAAHNWGWTLSPSVTLQNSNRIRIIVLATDVGTMAAGHTFNLGFAGPTAAADGDSWVEFTETITEYTHPSLYVTRHPLRVGV